MSDRHDPLSALAPGEIAPVAPATPRKGRPARRATLLRELDSVTDNSLAFLYGGPGHP
jgi:hypothetical protein